MLPRGHYDRDGDRKFAILRRTNDGKPFREIWAVEDNGKSPTISIASPYNGLWTVWTVGSERI